MHLARASNNRFTQVTSNDHAAALWVVTLLSIIYAVLVLAVRLGFTKWKTYGFDDIALTIAHLVAFGMWGSLLASLKDGLGKSYVLLVDDEITKLQRYFFASQILLYIALAFSKCSILILVRNVFTRNSKVSIISIASMAAVAIWGLVGVIATVVGCSADTIVPKADTEHCTTLVSWLRVLVAGDVATEMVIIFLPMIGFHGSIMSINHKAIVILAFSTRIPNIAFAIMHLLAYSKFITNRQPAISIVPTVAWQSLLLTYNLMSATTPLLKGFTQGFVTSGTSLGYLREKGGMGGGSGVSGSYELRSVTRTRSRSKITQMNLTNSQPCATLVQGNVGRASVSNPQLKDSSQYRHESASIASQDSRRIMIRREWEISED